MHDWRAELRARARGLRLPPEHEADVIEELAQHLEQEFSALAPRIGEAEAEAQLLARLDAGDFRRLGRARRSVLRRSEGGRDRLAAVFSPRGALADLRYAARRAGKHLGFTTVAVVSLALGIGANTAIFSLVDAVLLRRSPIPQRDRVAEIYQHQPSFDYAPFSYPDYVDFKKAANGDFSQVSIAQFTAAPRDLGGHVETLMAELVNGDYFPLLGLAPQAGRLLGPSDDGPEGSNPVVVLSNGYWQRSFGGDRGAVGRQIRLAGRAYTIVGVAPAGYEGTFPGLVPALFVPISMINQLQAGTGDQLGYRDNHSGFMKVRLAPGVPMARVRTLAANFTDEMRRRFPDSWTAGTSTVVVPESQVAVNPMIDGVVVPAVAALMVVVALVLLVACANLASFLLAQARDRQREIAIRVALGAGRWPLVRQLLIEASLLALLGAVAGVVVSRVALGALTGADLPLPIPIHLDVHLDGRVLAFTTLAAAVAALLIGLLPALQAIRPNAGDVIKSENTGGGPRRRMTARGALVVGQVAVSLVLLITATLFLRSLQARARIDPGFGHAPAGVVWVVIPPDRDSGEPEQLVLDQIEEAMRSLEGVRAVGVVDNMPLSAVNTQSTAVNVAGFTPPVGEPGFEVDIASADSGFFDAADVELLRGRGITAADVPDAPRVAVINEAMAERFWPGRDPIGATFRADSLTFHVVGVARTMKVRSLGEAPRMFFFRSFRQRPSSSLSVVARTSGDPDALAPQMVRALQDVDPSIMVMQATTMASHLETMLLPARLGAIIFGLFASVALCLAMIGVYGVVSYAVARRSREVGIRMAMGAQPAAIMRLLMREGVGMVAVGGVLGLGLALLVTRTLERLLTGVAALDPLSFVTAPLVLLGVGVLATYLPARRSTRTDPVRVLRAE